MALGAEAQKIFRMVLGESLKLSIIGLILGLIGAFLVSRVGTSFLFGVSDTDPLTFVSVSLLLIAVSFAASYLPARRAMAVDPVTALRRE
jgi:putative ABC transport system permease protein